MIITAVRIKRMENTGSKLKGIASITLDNMIVIHDIRILEGNSARFLAMPSKAVRAGVFKDIVHPISSEVRIAFAVSYTHLCAGYSPSQQDPHRRSARPGYKVRHPGS